MLQLSLGYVVQADREREVAEDLRNRQTLLPSREPAPRRAAREPVPDAAPGLGSRPRYRRIEDHDAPRRHLHLPGLRLRAGRHAPALRHLRHDPRGRLQRRAVRPPEPRPARPARELPSLARQPPRDGARARDQLPDRSRSRSRRSSGRSASGRVSRPTMPRSRRAPVEPAAGAHAAPRSSRPSPAMRSAPRTPPPRSGRSGGPTDDDRHRLHHRAPDRRRRPAGHPHPERRGPPARPWTATSSGSARSTAATWTTCSTIEADRRKPGAPDPPRARRRLARLRSARPSRLDGAVRPGRQRVRTGARRSRSRAAPPS